MIGITGGVGCGKSTVLNLIKENFNALIIMADDVAKDLMKKGKKGYDETIAFFGDEIIDETTGEIDRPKLASVIFSNPNKRIVLNSIINTGVKKDIVSITQAKIDNKYDYIFVEAALLLDDHYNVFCDETWYIYADEDSRRKRLKESRGYSDEKIDGIIKSQLGEEEFKKGCDIVVDNSGNINDTYAQLVKLLQM